MADTVTAGQQNPNQISFDIYKLISSSRSKHGVPTQNYNIYRKYLSKHLAELRKTLKMQCLDPKNSKKNQANNAVQNKLKKERLKKIKSGKLKIERDPNWNPKYKKYAKKASTWKKREVRSADLIKNGAECLLISLFLCERAWAFSKSIYESYDEDNKRKYHHSNSRLKKSIFHANKLFNLLLSIKSMNKDTVCQSFGYLSWLKSTYYLQTEQIELSFVEYLKSIKITHHSLSYLDRNLNEKLSYFNQNINKQKRVQIEQNVDKFINDLKEKEKLQLADEGKEEKEEEDIAAIVYIQYDENKIIIPNIDNLQELITLILAIKMKINTETQMNSFKKMAMFTKAVLLIGSALNIIQKQLKKAETDRNFRIEKYLLFEKLRFSICRQYLWIKTKNKTRNKHKILYELAVLSELQITNLDELATMNDLTNYKVFMQQIDILRNLFEIYRKYFIAKIYYFSIKNYMISYRILYHDLIHQCDDFMSKFKQFNDSQINSKSNMYDFAQLIDFNYLKEIMEHILNDSNKLSMLSKANCIISNAEKNNNTFDSKELEVIDLNSNNNSKLYPLLTKPIMIDIAWNYVDYHDILSSQKKKNDNQPKQPQKQASWFGGLFGK